MSHLYLDDKALEKILAKTQILMEALPHIQRFRDATIVIKYGGHAMIDSKLKSSVMEDIVLMENVGMKPVIVHGGGPEITSLMDRVGLESRFIDGNRITDAEALEIAEMVLAGKLNGEIVSHINRIGGRAVGLSGKDGRMIIARKMDMEPGRDMGYVGVVESLNTDVIRLLDNNEYIPVVSPIGADADGQTYNINADTVAAQISASLKARKLILLTDVRGICRDPKDPRTLIPRLTLGEIEGLMSEGIIRGGMIPKIRACQTALEAGVASTHILDGRIPHALLAEIFTDSGIGTMITA